MLTCIKCGHPLIEESKIEKQGIIVCNKCGTGLFVTPVEDTESPEVEDKPRKKKLGAKKKKKKYDKTKKPRNQNLNTQRIKQGRINSRRG